MTNNENEELTPHERELMDTAEEAERHIGDDLGRPVPGRAATTVRHTFSLKVGAEELDEIADAADAAGLSVGAYIRQAALEKARGQEGAVLKRVREQVRDLAETVKRL